jgi:DNA (cytosine-5)-methyltransferase 1
VCSGIEAATVAWEPLGWKPAWLSEIDPFAKALLAHHYPSAPNLGDMTKLHEKEAYRDSKIDILIGGTPCQSFSISGLRKGLRDPRGKLAIAFCKIAQEKRPRWVVWENVPGVLSSGKGRDFGAFLGALAKLGYQLAYRVLDAQCYGVAQRRRRVFLVGHLDGAGINRAERVLFDSEGGFWAAPPYPARGESPLAGLECGPPQCLSWESSSGEVSYCLLATGTGKGRNVCSETFLSDGLFGTRRLMPVEWERLMGFPDDYTLVPYRGRPAGVCPDGPRYKALGNSIVVPVLRWIGERIAAVDALPATALVHPEEVAKKLSDSELIDRCVQGFRKLKEIAPYLREARDRFSQPGRRVPVPGNPTWTEWVEANLGVTVRRVQQLLSEATEPSEIISPGPKRLRKLRTGDWRRLLKVSENRLARVFGPLEDEKELAGAIRGFAQGIADRFGEHEGRLLVSVSVKKARSSRSSPLLSRGASASG